MKSQEITTLRPEQFIYELATKGSRINTSPLQWTHEWLAVQGVSEKSIKNLLQGAGDWSGNVTDKDAQQSIRNDIIVCIKAIINSGAAKAGSKSSSNMTPEQRSERARKAALASAKVRAKIE